MIITATEFLENPYDYEWEDVLHLKKFCEKFIIKYKERRKQLKDDDYSESINSIDEVMDKLEEEFSEPSIAYITYKYQEVMKNPKVYFTLNPKSRNDTWVKALFLCSTRPVKTDPLDSLYILYRQTLDRIKLMKTERRSRK